MKNNVVPFPQMHSYKGFFVMARPVVIPYEVIKDVSIREHRSDDGEPEKIVVHVTIGDTAGISIVASDEDEANEIYKDFRKVLMSK